MMHTLSVPLTCTRMDTEANAICLGISTMRFIWGSSTVFILGFLLVFTQRENWNEP